MLRDSRHAAGLTQEMLAARAGLSARAISDLERNVNHRPRAGTVERLVDALSLSAQERQLFEVAARTSNSERTQEAGPAAGQLTRHASAPAQDRPRVHASGRVPPLVGRASEQGLLGRHIEGSGPPLLLLAGEPGIGKTRLLQEAAAQATVRGLSVLHGTVPAVGQGSLGDPLVDALRREMPMRSPVHLRSDLQGCAWLVRALPELGSGPIEPLPPIAVADEQAQALTAQAVVRFLANMAGSAGVLLTLDNLHQADAVALELLANVVQSATHVPLRIVGAYRDSESTRSDALSALLARLAHEQLVRHVTLSALANEDAAELLAVLLDDGGTIEDAWRERVLRQSGGVPFYLAAWAQDVQRGQGDTPADHVPWAIRQSIRYRIDAAPPSVRAVLEAIAVAGGRADYPLLASLAARANEQVFAALEVACRQRLVEEDGQGFRFAYEVVRAVVESDLSQSRRLLLGHRLAAAVQRELQVVQAGRARPTLLDEHAYHLAVLRIYRRVAPAAGATASVCTG